MKGLLFLRYERMKNMAKSYEMDMCNGAILGKVLTYSIPLMLSGVLPASFQCGRCDRGGTFCRQPVSGSSRLDQFPY